MISSSLFSHDDSPVWDPKAMGQILHISDDQLQILNNLPEWSKVIATDLPNLGITKQSSILTSQSSEVGSQISNIINPESHQSTKNIELFDKNLQYRKKLLATLELNIKRSKSSSLIEIGKHNDKDLIALKRTSSTPDIHLRNFHTKFNSTEKQFSNITVLSASQNKSKDIFSSTVEVDSLKVFGRNLSIPEYKSSKAKSYKSCEDMEIVTQQPINITVLKTNLSDKERFELTPEKQDKVSTHEEPGELSNLQNDKPVSNGSGENKEKSSLDGVGDSNNEEARINLMEEKQTRVSNAEEIKELSNLHSEKQVCDGHEIYEEKSCQVSSMNSGQDVDPSNKHELALIKMESDSCIKQAVFENNVSNSNQECINLDPENFEKSEISEDISSLSEKHSSDVVNILHNNKSPQAIDVSNTSSDKLAAAEMPMTFKRKGESKKSSKKRRCLQDKKGESDIRSLKKAGDITYSSEDITILLDLMKEFI